MAKLYDISHWSEQSWWNTGGTRDKKIYLNPDDLELYYFKQSFKKGQRDYKHEFWSEIIASEIGELLGFKVLSYQIAIRGEVVGCISKSMINQTSEELVEGGKYLQAFDNTFKPEDLKLRNQYNFELIRKALVSFNKENHLLQFIETIVFDAIIGNSDRHQENWAIINTHSKISESLTQIERDIKTGKLEMFPSWIQKLIKRIYTIKGDLRPEVQNVKLLLAKETRYAPIYDSGCSFGRELDDERITLMLNDEMELQKYVSKGLAEIHWNTTKISHFALVENLIKDSKLKEMVLATLNRALKNFDKQRVEFIVSAIDADLLKQGYPNGLPSERKVFIVKLLALRIRRLSEIHAQYT